MNNVFVYGTLKKGGRFHHALEQYEGKEATTVQLFHMKQGSWPLVRPDANGHPVKGELYNVTPETMKTLDYIEGYPTLFEKKRIHVTLEDGQQEEATVYVFNKDNVVPSYFTTVNPNEQGFLVY
jgi:gamma-glutamylcyclotransferase (GGCT)/AIG2-like uncharacterized protein YtfP